LQFTSVHKMARGRKKKQRAPKGRVEDDSANDTIQAEDSFNREFSENTRGVSTAVVSTDRQYSEQVLSAAPNLIQTEGIIASGTLGQGGTYSVRMREDYVPSPTPGPSTGLFAYNPVSSKYESVNRELFRNQLPNVTNVSELTFSVAPPLMQGRLNFNHGFSHLMPEMQMIRSGAATQFMTARPFPSYQSAQPPNSRGEVQWTNKINNGNYVWTANSADVKPYGEQGFAAAPNVLPSSDNAPVSEFLTNFYNQSTVPVCVNDQSTTAPTMAHPGVIPASSTQPVRSQQQQYVSSQVFGTAPSVNLSTFLTSMSTISNVESSIYVGTSVAPASVVVSQPPNYSMPVFHTYRVPAFSPNPDQMHSYKYSTVTSHPILVSHSQTLGVGPVLKAPNLMQHGMQEYEMDYYNYSLPQTISQPNAYGVQPAFANEQTYHNFKRKDMEVPKYKGFNDAHTPYEYIVELEKFQSILGYTDHDMLLRVIPMSLYGEAHHWLRLVKMSFFDLDEFKMRLVQRYRVVYENQNVNFESLLASESDSRVVSNEYSAYPGAEPNEFSVMQTSYEDYEVTHCSGAQSSSSDCSQNHA